MASVTLRGTDGILLSAATKDDVLHGLNRMSIAIMRRKESLDPLLTNYSLFVNDFIFNKLLQLQVLFMCTDSI